MTPEERKIDDKKKKVREKCFDLCKEDGHNNKTCYSKKQNSLNEETIINDVE